jgi:hypothetical protein
LLFLLHLPEVGVHIPCVQTLIEYLVDIYCYFIHPPPPVEIHTSP